MGGWQGSPQVGAEGSSVQSEIAGDGQPAGFPEHELAVGDALGEDVPEETSPSGLDHHLRLRTHLRSHLPEGSATRIHGDCNLE